MGYAMYMDVAFAGQLADINTYLSRTYSASEVIPAGYLVARAEQGEQKAKKATKKEDEILGICLRDVSAGSDGTEGFKPKSAIAVVNFGYVYIEVESDVKSGQPVFIRVVDDGELKVGGFSGKEDATKTNRLKLKNAKFVTSAPAGQIAQVELLGNLELVAV
ncbi:structural cement protein Gp24 (plasmid) [Pigmentibacter ruber]